MAYTTDQLQALQDALASGALRVRFQDRDVEYRSIAELKTAIAEVRNFYEAKLAEQQVLHESTLRKLLEPEAREVLEQEYRRNRERLSSERDRKIEKIRGK